MSEMQVAGLNSFEKATKANSSLPPTDWYQTQTEILKKTPLFDYAANFTNNQGGNQYSAFGG